MSLRASRRRVLGLIGGFTGASLLAACTAAPSPTSTPPPAKPAEAPKPTVAPPAPAAAATAAPAKPAEATKPAAAKPAESAKPAAAPPAPAGAIKEAVHWYTWSASDGEVWKQSLDEYNAKYKERGFQVKYEFQPGEQYGTKLLATMQAGTGSPDFGWGEQGKRKDWVKKGVLLPLDDVFKGIGFDVSDFTEESLAAARYDGKLYFAPLDVMSFQLEINADHAKEAGLDVSQAPNAGPTTGEELLAWAQKMTKREGDKVTRSGFLMTGAGPHPNVMWGIVAHQMGFRRASEDLKKAMINPDAAKQAAQWVLDLFDKHKVATRDITDRYKAFGTGDGSMFVTGPWTLNGYVTQGLNFVTVLIPKIGQDRLTRFELFGLEMYTQKETGRYETTGKIIQGLSDESFLWTTKGRGVSLRKSILKRPDYTTAGHPLKVRSAFLEGQKYATIPQIPVLASDDFDIYTGSLLVAKAMDPVWAKQTSIDAGLKILADQWQKDLDAG